MANHPTSARADVVRSVMAGIASCAVFALIASGSFSREPMEAPSPEIEPETRVTFCAEGLEALADDACFARPRVAARGLVVFLHGRYSPAMERTQRDTQARVARLATQRGFAMLALRGVQGECTAPDFADYFCFPSNARNAGDGPAFVTRLTPLVARAREYLHDAPIFVFGFSNGAYFASLLAERAWMPMDAVVIAHGGPVHAFDDVPRRETPALLETADDDASDGEMRDLDREMSRRKWPHEIVAREGTHALPDWDIEMAMTFFERTRTERLPLDPPLRSRSQRQRDQ